jgi:GNAT superfamily N-acetyltransferase
VTQIREATPADVEIVVSLGLRFAREGPYARMPMTEASIRALAAWMFQHGVILLTQKAREDVGMVGVAVLPHMLSGRLYGAEVFWWCNPEARGHGLRLMRAAESWARAHGAETMQFVAPTEEVERLYTKLGYTQLETAYEKDLVCQPA